MYLCLLLIKVCIREFFFQWGRGGYTFQMLRTNAVPTSTNRPTTVHIRRKNLQRTTKNF